MDRKYKIMLLILLLICVINLGICFAVFTINIKLNSTGIFSINVLQLRIGGIEYQEEDSNGCNLPNFNPIINETNLSGINVQLLYPGANCWFKIDVENIGDIDAILNYTDIDIEIPTDENNLNNIDINLYNYDKSIKLNNSLIHLKMNMLKVKKTESIYLNINYNFDSENIYNDIELNSINIKLPYIAYGQLEH